MVLKEVLRELCKSLIIFCEDLVYPPLGDVNGDPELPEDLAAVEDVFLVFSSITYPWVVSKLG